MRAVIAPEPLLQVLSDPNTGRVCVSAWMNVGATSISTDIWLSAEQALEIAQRMADAAKAITAPPAALQAAE